jgi:hypothetical protein
MQCGRVPYPCGPRRERFVWYVTHDAYDALKKLRPDGLASGLEILDWLRGLDLNQRPSGYEPDELPGCSTPRMNHS